jgi:hypothetical protein
LSYSNGCALTKYMQPQSYIVPPERSASMPRRQSAAERYYARLA